MRSGSAPDTAAPPHPVPPAHRGLSSEAARRRLAERGFNELPSGGRRTLLRILSEVLQEPMLALLLAAGILYLALGEMRDALVLLAFALLSVTITLVQEARTERAIEALRELSSPRALVIRDGVRMRIAGREVVEGDLLVLAEGDRVAADVRILEAMHLQVDESLLTGESIPVRKRAVLAVDAADAQRPGGDDRPMAYAGTLVVHGSGIGEVVATGRRSEMGRIGASLGAIALEPPRLRVESKRVLRWIALAGATVTALVVLLLGLQRGDWLQAWLAGIAVSMSMLPEEIPVVITVFLAMGAWRLAGERVLARRASVIETLGAATVLCTDKTGTLTENRMAVVAVRPCVFGDAHGRTADKSDVLRAAQRASLDAPFDPMERALHSAADSEPLAWPDGRIVHSHPLTSELLAMANVWSEGPQLHLYSKGAPEAIARLCALDESERAQWLRMADELARDGARVLGVAHAILPAQDPRSTSLGERTLAPLGLVALRDPLRPHVPEAVRSCREAGIRVVMITGDLPATAAAIARQAGIGAARVLTGPELERLGPDELADRVLATDVFARILPEQKLRIVEVHKRAGAVVAMTGDGVNDTPSMKAAHIGIAMGARGSDVAREASSIVLLDDDFRSMVAAIRRGRIIYDNLRKSSVFIVAAHVPIAGLAVLPLAFGHGMLLTPVHIALLELVIDPACSLVFEAEGAEADVMRRPPRPAESRLLSGGLVAQGLMQGAVALAACAAVYAIARSRPELEAIARTLTFAALVACIVALIFANRARTRPQGANRPLLLIVLALGLAMPLILLHPGLAPVFDMPAAAPSQLWLPVLAAASAWLVLVLLMQPRRRRAAAGAPRG